MPEIAIERLERRVFGNRVQNVLAHTHQRERAARRMVEPADQLLPRRLRAVGKIGRLRVVRRLEERAGGGGERGEVGAEPRRRALQPRAPLRRAQRAVAVQDRARGRGAGGLAAPPQQLHRQVQQRLDPERLGTLDAHERTTTFGDALQQPRKIGPIDRRLGHARAWGGEGRGTILADCKYGARGRSKMAQSPTRSPRLELQGARPEPASARYPGSSRSNSGKYLGMISTSKRRRIACAGSRSSRNRNAASMQRSGATPGARRAK